MAAPIIPRVFATAGLNTPGAWLDEDYEAIRAWIDDRNPAAGPIASRPSAGNVGALWVATDQFNLLYIDTGATWLQVGYLASNLPGASFFDYDGIATPATPSAGHGRSFLPSTASGLRPLSWVDAGGQVSRFPRILLNHVGAPFRDINTTNLETSVYTSPAPITTPPTIKGGTIGTDRALLIETEWDIQNNTGASRGFLARYKYGGTTYALLVTTGEYATTATRYGFDHRVIIQATGATNTQYGRGRHNSSGTANVNGGDGGTSGTTAVSTHESAGIDTTVDQALDVTIQPEISSASLSIRLFSLRVSVL